MHVSGEGQVLISVEPRILGDVLAVLMRRPSVGVSVCPPVDRRSAPREPRRFTVAVVSGDLPRDAAADTVIRVQEPEVRSCLATAGWNALDGLLADVDRALADRT
jgi:hypothetical protein